MYCSVAEWYAIRRLVTLTNGKVNGFCSKVVGGPEGCSSVRLQARGSGVRYARMRSRAPRRQAKRSAWRGKMESAEDRNSECA